MKSRLFVLLLLSAAINLSGFAQVKFGVKGGLNRTSLNYSYKNYDFEKDRNGFFFGPTAKVALPLGFSVDGALLYDQRSAEVEAQIDGGRIYPTIVKQQQIVVPVNLRYTLFKPIGLYLFAGSQVGFNVGDKSITTNYADWDFKKAQLSVNMGAGVLLFKHLQASVNYNLACSKSIDMVINKTSHPDNIGNGKFNAWQFSVGYFF